MKREKMIGVKVTDEEYERIRRLAFEAKKSLGAYVRDHVLGTKKPGTKIMGRSVAAERPAIVRNQPVTTGARTMKTSIARKTTARTAAATLDTPIQLRPVPAVAPLTPPPFEIDPAAITGTCDTGDVLRTSSTSSGPCSAPRSRSTTRTRTSATCSPWPSGRRTPP